MLSNPLWLAQSVTEVDRATPPHLLVVPTLAWSGRSQGKAVSWALIMGGWGSRPGCVRLRGWAMSQQMLA